MNKKQTKPKRKAAKTIGVNAFRVQRRVRHIAEYKPYMGFYDLRKYNLSKKIFLKLWNIQDMLYDMIIKKEYYKKWHPIQWEKAKELSASYQQILFQYA